MNRNFLFVSFCIIALLIILIGYLQYDKKLDDIAEKSKSEASVVDSWSIDPDKIHIYSFNGEIMVYIKGSKEESDKYVGYNIKHSSKELDNTEPSSNYDVWNLNGRLLFSRGRGCLEANNCL